MHRIGSPLTTSPQGSAETDDAWHVTDEELLSAHLAGEPDAFRQLFARYAPRVFSAMIRQGLARSDAHDLVQQTFLLLHQARNDFEPGLRVRPWLWTIAFNLIRAERRGRGRSEARLDRVARERQVGTALPTHEERYGVRLAIHRLPAHQQEVVMLHWYEGLSFPEIALVVEASESAVKVRAHRAYQRLRELIDGSPRDTGG